MVYFPLLYLSLYTGVLIFWHILLDFVGFVKFGPTPQSPPMLRKSMHGPASNRRTHCRSEADGCDQASSGCGVEYPGLDVGVSLKWWVSPTNPSVFLPKIIIFLVVWGYHHLTKHHETPMW